MTIRITRSRVLAAALAGLVAVLPAAPAVGRTSSWVEAPCATGAITQYAGTVDGLTRHVTLSGWIQPCGEVPAGAAFATIRYDTETAYALVHSLPRDRTGGLFPFESTTGPTEFNLDYLLFAGDPALEQSLFRDLQALCIARGLDAPVACVAIELPDRPAAPVVTPIPTDDHRVRQRATMPHPPSDFDAPNPLCGNCV
jgi:hypothetical protein